MKTKSIYVSRGNMKVKASIFNLPCGITCKAGLSCHKYCYAKKAERLYPNVKPCRLNNLEQSKGLTFIDDMTKLLSKRKSEYIRVHESGDFYSESYILKWYSICRRLPNKTFYAYTKRDDLFNADILANKPKNLILLRSIDGIQTGKVSKRVPKGYDKLVYTHETNNNCPAIKSNKIKCMVDCVKCATSKKEVIIFKKH